MFDNCFGNNGTRRDKERPLPRPVPHWDVFIAPAGPWSPQQKRCRSS